MNTILILLILAGFLFYAHSGGVIPGTSSLSGLFSTPKLGNNDPNFEPWLAQEIAMLIGPESGTAPFRASDATWLENAIRNRRIPDYAKRVAGDCASAGPIGGAFANVQQAGQIAGLGVSAAQAGASIAGATVSAIPIVGSAINLFTGIFSAIGGHHQAAVALEQSTLCRAVPDANAVLAQLDASYRAGQIGGAQIKTALEQLFQQFQAVVSAIARPAAFNAAESQQSHTCNAACVYERALRGIIDAKVMFDY
jgi:hypothetical protein